MRFLHCGFLMGLMDWEMCFKRQAVGLEAMMEDRYKRSRIFGGW